MKKSVIANLFAATALTLFTLNGFAAVPGGPKPSCKFGEILVKQGDHWVCKTPSIKSQSMPENRSSSGAKKFAPVEPAKPPRVAAKKADLVILDISRVGGTDNKFGVQIKNQGEVGTHGGQLYGANYGSDGGSASTPMPTFKAGETKHVFITFNMSEFNRGDRVRFHADGNNQIPESNENNNVKFYTFQ